MQRKQKCAKWFHYGLKRSQESEVRSKKQGARSKKQETEIRRQEAGARSKEQEARKQVARGKSTSKKS
jgi:hypothetical protein